MLENKLQVTTDNLQFFCIHKKEVTCCFFFSKKTAGDYQKLAFGFSFQLIKSLKFEKKF